MDDYCKRSGQIPAFGEWDYANELPITQYFECARQAGLIRFSTSSGESNPYVPPHDLYQVDSRKRSCDLPPSTKATEKEKKKGGRVCDVTEPPRKYHSTTRNCKQLKYDDVAPNPKRVPVDEDLYKIPPELLRSSKREKMWGFFSCLVPGCAT